MNRKIYYWKLRTSELQLGEKTLVMGVLNITPDSFSDGGRFSDPDRAYARALELEEQGADLIDIGAESTRPDSKRISADEEWQRLLPVLKKLRDKLSIPLSLDTYKSEIAERALEFGVEIFNDPSGLTFDPELAKTAANANAGLILNHMRGLPEMWAKMPALPDVVGTIAKEIEATASRARRSGVEKNRIVLDPGIGFGKRKEQNSEILAHLGRLAALDYPILVGPSRKSFLTQAPGGETIFATAAAVTAAILNGAHIVRVHDVKEMKAVAHVADEIARMAAVTPAPAHEEKERPVERRRPDGARPQAPRFGSDERFVPTRPPLARPVAPPAESGEAHAEKPPVTEDRPVRRDSDGRPPRRDFQDRPPHKPWQDRPPRGRFDDRPPRGRSEDRPPRGPSQDRPPRGRSEDRPPRGPSQDRPPRGRSEDRPFRGPSQDRPSRGPWQDRDRPFKGGRPDRGPGFRPDRGPGGRPDRGPGFRPDRGPGGRPDRGPGGRPPRGDFQDRGPRGGGQGRPPRGGASDRPPQDRPPKRVFRKRP